nr:hypothetical protein BHI3_08820 [Bacteriovorax sp. HI3]
MDTEVQKVRNVIKIVEDNLSGSKQLPEHGFPINPVFLTEAVHAVSINGLKKLAQKFSPTQVFPLIYDLNADECDVAVQRINDLKEEIDYGLLLSIGWIHRLALTNGTEHFENKNIMCSSEEELGEFLSRCLLDHTDVFYEVVNRIVGDEFYKGTSFAMFKCNKPRTQIIKIPFDSNLKTEFESDLKEHLKETGCGDFCNLLPNNYGKNNGIYVERGGKRNGKPVIDLHEKACSRRDRPRKTDIAFYEVSTHCLWMSAKGKHDILKYKMLMGEKLFGDPTAFKTQVGFKLNFVRTDDLSGMIQTVLQGRITKIKIKKVVFKSNSQSKKEQKFTAVRNGCLLEDSSFMQERMDAGIPCSILIEIEFNNNPKMRDKITFGESTLKTGNLIREEEMVAILYGLGIMEKSYDA